MPCPRKSYHLLVNMGILGWDSNNIVLLGGRHPANQFGYRENKASEEDEDVRYHCNICLSIGSFSQ